MKLYFHFVDSFVHILQFIHYGVNAEFILVLFLTKYTICTSCTQHFQPLINILTVLLRILFNVNIEYIQ